jgi:hypothetical protein
MAMPSKLTPEQWGLARRRWEGTPQDGFAWLSREIEAAWAVVVGRKSLEQAARLKAWRKSNEPAPELPKMVGGTPDKDLGNIPLRGSKRNVPAIRNIPASQQPAGPPPEVADEVVDGVPDRQRHAAGRPTKYRPEFAEKIVAYFDVDPEVEVRVEQPNGLVKLQRMATKPPMLVGFAKSIGVDLTTLNRWATEIDGGTGKPRFPDFADAYAHARDLQEALIAQAALLSLYDSKSSHFLLKNLHGWQDQPARKIAVAPISKDELEARFGARMAAARERMQAVLAERRDLLVDDPGDDE